MEAEKIYTTKRSLINSHRVFVSVFFSTFLSAQRSARVHVMSVGGAWYRPPTPPHNSPREHRLHISCRLRAGDHTRDRERAQVAARHLEGEGRGALCNHAHHIPARGDKMGLTNEQLSGEEGGDGMWLGLLA